MSHRRRSGAIAWIGLGIALTCAAASPASARRIAIDSSTPKLLSSFCTVGGASCAAHNFGGVFGSIYVYNDGIISVGQPLPSTASVAGGLGTFGSSYLAPGLYNYGNLDGIYVNDISFNQAFGQGYFNANGQPVVGELRIDWVFGPSNNESIFELDMIDTTLVLGNDPGTNPSVTDDVSAFFNYGADTGSWFDGGNESDPFLYPGSTIAWNIGGQSGTSTTAAAFGETGGPEIDNLHFAPATVPEPATWAMMIVGFGLGGSALRRRGRAAPQPA
jgi:hypothetical protein